MMQGVIAILFKEKDSLRLTNRQPSMLPNTHYKIFAKTLRRRPRPLLVEVIDNDQIVFLPFRLILDKKIYLHMNQFNGQRILDKKWFPLS